MTVVFSIESVIGFVIGLVVIALISLVLILRIRKLHAQELNNQERIFQQTQAQLLFKREQEEQVRLKEFEQRVVVLDTKLAERDTLMANQLEQLKAFDVLKTNFSRLETQLQAERDALKTQQNTIDEVKVQLFKEFELSASKLYEAKQKTFVESSKQNIESVIGPFKTQLSELNKRIEDNQQKESEYRNQLVGQIGELQKQALKIGEDANNLAQALKGDNKMQGDWGEIVLERLLEQSGLEKGREYETQLSFSGEDSLRRPDVVVRLPDSKDIVIDAKVSLVEYERFIRTEKDSEKREAIKRHVDSIRSHIKGLSAKEYEKLEGIRTLDFIFLFVPIEGAYMAALSHQPSLFKEAYDKNIILVSPSNLMVALRTIETIWRFERQNTNVEKIALGAGRLYDEFVRMAEAMETLGGNISKTQKSYEDVLGRLTSKRGNLVKRVEDLRKLGAKTSKKMPPKMLESSELEYDQLEKDQGSDQAEH